MRKVHEAIEIEAPIEVVFDFVADFKNALLWMHGFTRFEAIGETTRGVGAKVRAIGTLRGFPVTTLLEITEFVANTRLVSVSNSGLRSVSAWSFATTCKGTRVSFEGQYEPPAGPIGGLMSAVWLSRELSDHTWRSLKNLKRLLEAKSNGDFHP